MAAAQGSLHRSHARHRSPIRSGFSLMEMLFSLAILAIVSSGVFTLFYNNNFAATVSPDLCNAMGDAQSALRGMLNDLRAGTGFAVPSNTGGVRVTLSGGTATEYYQNGTALMRLVTTGGSTTTVVTGLVPNAGLSLKYYDGGMNLIAGPMDSTKYGQAAAVDVTVTLNLANASFGQVTRTTRILLRNKPG